MGSDFASQRTRGLGWRLVLYAAIFDGVCRFGQRQGLHPLTGGTGHLVGVLSTPRRSGELHRGVLPSTVGPRRARIRLGPTQPSVVLPRYAVPPWWRQLVEEQTRVRILTAAIGAVR